MNVFILKVRMKKLKILLMKDICRGYNGIIKKWWFILLGLLGKVYEEVIFELNFEDEVLV